VKVAVVGSDDAAPGSFSIGGFTGAVGPDQGPWGPFRHTYRLDFSSLTQPGTYTLKLGVAESLPFRIGAGAYDEVFPALARFLKLQRCGDNPITGKKCHQKDGMEVDLVGGWHDAGDSLKHMITTTYAVAALFLAGETEEARWGAALVKKIHPKPDVLYVQVADDRDHTGGFRFWEDDVVDYGAGPGGGRPGWRATGQPDGPKYKNASTGLASLAGRSAAAMALAGEIDTAKSLYRLAKDHPGYAQSVPVKAPHYYAERTYHDDLEWAAVELFRATKERGYLEEAVRFADAARDESWMGKPSHGHYEFFPYVNLAHWRLYELVDADTKARLATYYRNGLEEIRRRAEANPFRLGTPLVWCSTNDVVAFATQAVLYETMTGDRRYRALATEARDWIFGRNPWGVSFVTGIGAVSATNAHHPYRAIPNAHRPTGGLVDGPLATEIHAQFERYMHLDGDPLARFQSEIATYHDAVGDFATNEPTLDGTVALYHLLTLWK
jgi:hypothetical protein